MSRSACMAFLMLSSASGFALRVSARPATRRLATAVLTKPALSSVVSRAPAVHPAFDLVSTETVTEYSLQCATYVHRASGAEVISAQADDDNKVFGVVFRTPVEDSTGVPHILEHSVLCGSDKYTSKEPFAELLKGSLQTFLNAFTYPDRTCYPVASQNTKDFYNLAHVYMDAVLHPRCVRDTQVFAQEGWHYELESPEADLTYNGVVFNEMKGAYSSPDSLLYKAAQELTFPDNTYAVDSGGDPAAITTLTYDGFKSFHTKFYHPANSRIFFYGDDNLEDRLEFLDSYLKDYKASDVDVKQSEVATQKLIPNYKKRAVVKHPAAEGESNRMVLLSWLLHEAPLSAEDELALGVLDHLLMGTPQATLYKALTESGLGDALVGGGVGDSLKQATFSAGLKGVTAENVAKVEALVVDTLAGAVRDGFDAEAVEASLNTIEFAMREFNTGGFPKGLSIMLGILPKWIYGTGPVFDALRFEEPLAALKKRLAAGDRVFEDLLQKLVVGNDHLAIVEMVPDANLNAGLIATEKAKLAAAKAKMSPADLDRVIAETKALKEAQLREDSPEDLASIPAVGLADIDRKIKEVPTILEQIDGVNVLTHPLPTAGVVYADVLFNVMGLPLEDLPLLRLFITVLPEIGVKGMDAVTLQRRIGARTGGIGAALLYSQRVSGDGVSDPMDAVAHFCLSGKATSDNADELFDLMHKMVAEADWTGSQAKTVELLRETKSSLESAFVSSGNSFAGMRLSARNSLVGHVAESTQGVSYYAAVKLMLDQATTDWPALLKRLTGLRDAFAAKENLVINLTADAAALDGAKAAVVARVLDRAPAQADCAAAKPWAEAVVLLPRVNEAYAVPTQVNYVAAGAPLYAIGEQMDAGALAVAARFVSRAYLWDNVRVAGGAYGAGCSLNPFTGAFAFSSYRDPNLGATLDIFAATASILEEAAAHLTDEALEQAVVGAVGDLDSPLTSQQKGSKALEHHLTGVTPQIRQQYRDSTIATSRESFAALAKKLRAAEFKGAVFGSKDAIDAANAKRPAGQQFSVNTILGAPPAV
ncbi:Metalloenzyme, LuxS/M16 peptidase-like protein [Pelagophyceae sp. CCMP2097]|nr:Metalloenzyme, LuxS/M16 peptidase-like protein [Pelagophyceae sp. CCMP2097]|mmetsp:Transcript_25730/g.88414  ORF Transcript_25730/g.88414 Transcript_25730/m.88414 type:complete len:1048 (-) Transcript_25730:45-3188(-)